MRTALTVIAFAIAALWIIEVVDSLVFDDRLEVHGILPRTITGVDGVLWAPLLHGDYGHVLANTVPFAILGGLVMLRGPRRWAVITAAIVVLGGLGTWVFGRAAFHIGASGLVFGYLGFLLTVGFVERSFRAIAVGVLAGVLYGGLLWGLLPSQSGVSWESHLFGLLAGGVTAWALYQRDDKSDQPQERAT